MKATEEDAPLLWRCHSALPGHQAQGARADRGDRRPHRASSRSPCGSRSPSAPPQSSTTRRARRRRSSTSSRSGRCASTPSPTASSTRRPGSGSGRPSRTPPTPSGSWVDFDVAAADGRRHRDERSSACGAGNASRRPAVPEHDPAVLDRTVRRRLLPAGRATRCTASTPTAAEPTQTVASGHPLHPRPHDEGDRRRRTGRSFGAPGSRPVDCPSTRVLQLDPRLVRGRARTSTLDVGSRARRTCSTTPATSSRRETRTTSQMRYCLVRTGESDRQSAILTWAPQFSTDQDMNCSGGAGDVDVHDATGTHPQIATRLARERVRDPGPPAEDERARLSRLQRTIRRRVPQHLPLLLHGNGFSGDSVRRPARRSSTSRSIGRSWATSSGRRRQVAPADGRRRLRPADVRRPHHRARLRCPDEDAASQPVGRDALLRRRPRHGRRPRARPGRAADRLQPRRQLEPARVRRLRPGLPEPQVRDRRRAASGPRTRRTSSTRRRTARDTAGFFDTAKPDPFAGWPPYRCVLTQTGNSSQVIQGFNERIFNKSNNPSAREDDAART